MMVSNRIQRVYVDYLKNSEFGVFSLPGLFRSHNVVKCLDYLVRHERWRRDWQVPSRLFWGWCEYDSKHCEGAQRVMIAALSFYGQRGDSYFFAASLTLFLF